MIDQIDGNASVGSQSESDDDKDEQTDEDESGDESEYDTDDEVDSEPIRPVLIQSEEQSGELEVEVNERVQPPASLPLCLCLNARSVYNKKDNLKNILNTLAPCIYNNYIRELGEENLEPGGAARRQTFLLCVFLPWKR